MNDAANHIQVVDYAAWQRKHLEGQVLDTELAWWKQTLEGAPPLLELPWEKPRPDMATSAGIAVPLSLEPGVAAALRKLAAAERSTLFVVVLSAIQVQMLVLLLANTTVLEVHPSPFLLSDSHVFVRSPAARCS